jgi:hypothetical protein
MSLWLEIALVVVAMSALVAIVWVPLLAMDYRRRKSGQPGLDILRFQARFAIVGLAFAVVAFLAVLFAPR